MGKRAAKLDLEPAMEVARRAVAAAMPTLVTSAQVAKHWRISTEAIPYWVRKKWLPEPIIAPNKRRYFPASVLLAPPPPAENSLDNIKLDLSDDAH